MRPGTYHSPGLGKMNDTIKSLLGQKHYTQHKRKRPDEKK